MNRTAYLFAFVAIIVAAGVLRTVEYAPGVSLHRPLENLPLQFSVWRGQTGYLTPDVLAVLRADDYLLRRYEDTTGHALWLYVAYYSSQPPDTRLHSPAVCLPGAGWYIAQSGLERISLPGRTVTVNRNLIQKGGDQQVVLYWYQMQGAVAAKELQAVGLLAWVSLTQHRSDEALVRVNAPLAGGLEETVARETAFVRAVFPRFNSLLPQ
ncbi:MAG TPA: EpsI family protein [bacterium]|nr:EpsI family protein [bacterium]